MVPRFPDSGVPRSQCFPDLAPGVSLLPPVPLGPRRPLPAGQLCGESRAVSGGRGLDPHCGVRCLGPRGAVPLRPQGGSSARGSRPARPSAGERRPSAGSHGRAPGATAERPEPWPSRGRGWRCASSAGSWQRGRSARCPGRYGGAGRGEAVPRRCLFIYLSRSRSSNKACGLRRTPRCWRIFCAR